MSDEMAKLTIDKGYEDVVVARLSGEVDLANVTVLGEQLRSVIPNKALGLVLDLTNTTYLDSSGVSLVFDLADRLRRRQQQLRLVAPADASLRRVLRIVDPSGALPLTESIEAAVAEIRAAA
jgi:anti-anti-sigma factor